MDYIAGYTLGLDMTVRGVEDRSFRKSCDGYAPVGPCMVTADEIPDPNNVPFTVHLNGKLQQDAHTKDMIFDVPALISFLSEGMTLLPGTVILTGTPQGVGFARNPPIFLKAGDTVTIRIEGIGELSNPVEEEK